MLRMLQLFLTGATLVAVAFAAFVLLQPIPRPLPAEAQGIAVLTGGQGRVDMGFRYLQHSLGVPMLITGVHPEVTLGDLLQTRTLTDDQLMRLSLDHSALTTRQNITAIQAWAQKNNIQHVGLVTADYHMHRALLLSALFAPELTMTPLPVPTEASWRFQAREFGKLLIAPFLK